MIPPRPGCKNYSTGRLIEKQYAVITDYLYEFVLRILIADPFLPRQPPDCLQKSSHQIFYPGFC